MRAERVPSLRVLYGKSEVISRESGIAILFIGHMSGLGESVWKAIKEAGYHCSLINARFAKPLDTELIRDLCRDHELIVTIEENVLAGGFGEQVVQYVMQTGEKTRYGRSEFPMIMWNTEM